MDGSHGDVFNVRKEAAGGQERQPLEPPHQPLVFPQRAEGKGTGGRQGAAHPVVHSLPADGAEQAAGRLALTTTDEKVPATCRGLFLSIACQKKVCVLSPSSRIQTVLLHPYL